MYLTHYKLNKKPFQINTDPTFLWLGEKHKKILSSLKYGVLDNKGFLLLTGDVGTGKTTLINGFANDLGDDVIVAKMSDPGLSKLGFMKYIAEMFKIESSFSSKDEFLIHFSKFLNQAFIDNKKVLLIIDEAQHLTGQILEEIRLLSNIERQETKLLNIFLVGQNEFGDTLEKYQHRALRQRIAISYTLDPFDLGETGSCIKHRLEVAGNTTEIFTEKAIEAVYELSEGFPRLINILCDHALLSGYLQEQKEISEGIVWKCGDELNIAHLTTIPAEKRISTNSKDWLEESELQPPLAALADAVYQPQVDIPVDPPKQESRAKSRWSIGATLLLFVTMMAILLSPKQPDKGLSNKLDTLQPEKAAPTPASTTMLIAAQTPAGSEETPEISDNIKEKEQSTKASQKTFTTPEATTTETNETTETTETTPIPQPTTKIQPVHKPAPVEVQSKDTIAELTETTPTPEPTPEIQPANEPPTVEVQSIANVEDSPVPTDPAEEEAEASMVAEKMDVAALESLPAPAAGKPEPELLLPAISPPPATEKEVVTTTKIVRDEQQDLKKDSSTENDDPGAVIDWLLGNKKQ